MMDPFTLERQKKRLYIAGRFQGMLDERGSETVLRDLIHRTHLRCDENVDDVVRRSAKDERKGIVTFVRIVAKPFGDKRERAHVKAGVLSAFAAERKLRLPTARSGLVAIERIVQGDVCPGRLVVLHDPVSMRRDGAQDVRKWRLAYRRGEGNERVALATDWFFDSRYEYLLEAL